jgi:hypothetical protein
MVKKAWVMVVRPSSPRLYQQENNWDNKDAISVHK